MTLYMYLSYNHKHIIYLEYILSIDAISQDKELKERKHILLLSGEILTKYEGNTQVNYNSIF